MIGWVVLIIGWVVELQAFNADSTVVKSDTTRLREDSITTTKEFDPPVRFTEKFYWESYIRARHELWDNQEDLNDDLDDLYSFFRVKLFLGAGFKPTDNTQFYARIVNESRLYGHKGDGDSIDNDHLWRPERHYFELVFAQLFFRWKQVAGLPIDFKIGRQYLHDIGFGDQWLIGDGTPVDGSKTFYFNAIRVKYAVNDYSTLDVIATHNQQEDPLVIVSEADRTITNITDEWGGWVWWKSQWSESSPYNLYYIFKHEEGGGGFHREEASDIHTLGFHIKPESKSWWLSAQMAGQWGEYGNVSRSGFGGILYGGIKLQSAKWQLKAGPWFMYLTGDDPETREFEAFNNLFGGYPNDDELYLNTYARESGTSMWTNINLIGAYLEYLPVPRYNIRFWYHYMRANHLVSGDFFGNGKTRGHMVMLKAMANISDRLKAYYMFEYFLPGDFYQSQADDAILSRINFEWYF